MNTWQGKNENYIQLDTEELEILKAFEKKKLNNVKNQKMKIAKYSKYAKDSVKKDHNLNMRISGRDLEH